MRNKLYLIFFLFVNICIANEQNSDVEYFKLGKTNFSWEALQVEKNWQHIPRLKITKRSFGAETPKDYNADFAVTWNDSGIVFDIRHFDEVDDNSTKFGADGRKRPSVYDSAEVRVNNLQFIISGNTQKALVTGYPIALWKGKNKKYLNLIKAKIYRKDNITRTLVFLPWKSITTDNKPPTELLNLACGINDTDTKQRWQYYSPTSFKFNNPGTYATVKLSKKYGNPETWESSHGLIPQFIISYDKEGHICILFKAREKLYNLYKKNTVKLKIYNANNPKNFIIVKQSHLKIGYNRIKSTELYNKLNNTICEIEGFATINNKKIAVSANQRFVPIKGGFANYKLRSKTPDDLREFWENEIAKAKTVLLNPQVKYLKTLSSGTKVFEVIIKGTDGVKFISYLTLPKGIYKSNKKIPCMVWVPGYGGTMKPKDLASDGLACLSINVRSQGGSKKYFSYKHKGRQLLAVGIENRDTYYYKDVYMDVYRAIEYLLKHPNINSKKIGIRGASQGGSIALALSAMHPDISLCISVDPGFCGWEMIRGLYPKSVYSGFITLAKGDKKLEQKILNNLLYYDIAILSQWITCPTIFVNDYISYPETTAIAFQNIPAKDKMLFAYPRGKHCYTEKDFHDAVSLWQNKFLGAIKK